MSSELEPAWRVTAWLDGDDSPQEQTANFEAALNVALQGLVDDSLALAFLIERQP